MLSKINWLFSRIFSIIIESILNIFIKRKNNLFLFGSKPIPYKKDYFLHNTKYLFLYLQSLKNIKTVWLCDDLQMITKLKLYGFKNVYKRRSLRGICAILLSKYWFVDGTANQITRFNSAISKTKIINFWHGAGGLKKVGFSTYGSLLKFEHDSLQDKIYNLIKTKDDYFIVNSLYEGTCRKIAHRATDEQIKILGSPRLDVLYKDIPNAEIFMEEDFHNIKLLKKQGKKLIIYMPTFRDTGKDISGWLKSYKLREFLKNSNSVLICKLHPFDNSSLAFEMGEEFYKMANDSDVYPILKYTDALITDYSSVYFDYLHLNKPILYYIPDLEEYETQCRGFYRPYETLTAGAYAKNESELLNALQDVIKGVDNYEDKRKALLDEMFVYQDGNNCERVIKWLRSLNND